MDKFLHYGVILAAAIVAVQSLRWADCGSTKGKIAKVTVTDCENTPICDLKQGSTYTFSVDFTPNEGVTKATTVVHGVLAGIPVPFPVDNPNACKDSGLTCPLTSGTAVSYHSDIHVLTSYPKIKVLVKWEVKDQNGDDLVCVTLPAQIVEGGSSKKVTLNQIINHTKKDNTLRFKSLV